MSAIKANEKALDSLAVSQHHDAVSGTSREGIMNDYENRLIR